MSLFRSLRFRITALFTLLYGVVFVLMLAWFIDHVRVDILENERSHHDTVDHIIEESVLVVAASIPLVLLVVFVSGYYLARRLLHPIDRIIDKARKLSSHSLEERIPLPDTNDEIGRLVVALNEMLERLQDSFTRMEHFAANASHELRTPITVLKGELEVALQRSRSATEYESLLQSNLEEVQRLSRTVDNLLMLAKMDSGTIPFEMEQVALQTLIELTVAQVSLAAEAHDVRLVTTDVDDVTVAGDVVLLTQLLLNLVENAIKYNARNGRVVIAARSEGGDVLLTVEDNGIGIAPDQLPHVFVRFFRVHGDRVLRRGSGLGLSIARWIAELHGGSLTVESTLGVGSRFTLRLPASR
jgi:heavy metal sensor kinase